MLEKAFGRVVEKHAVLRSRFTLNEAQEPVQIVTESTPNISNHQTTENLTLQDVITSLVDENFDLGMVDPYRLAMIDDGKDLYLLMVFHHIAFDGWSADIFLKDLATAYNKLNKGVDSPLPALEVGFGDYAAWNAEVLANGRMDELEHYWLPQLKGYQNLELSTDHSRPSLFDYQGIETRYELSESLSSALRHLAEAQSVTLNTIMISAFYVALAKLSGQQDIVIGIPSDNRSNRDTQEIIGLFINALPIRFNADRTSSLETLFIDASSTLLNAKTHEDMPFEALTQCLGVERDSSRHPIFQVMFSVQSFASNEQERSALPFTTPSSEVSELFPQRAKFDLNMFVDDSGNQLQGELVGASALFSEKRLTQIVDMYRHVLESFIASPTQSISDIASLTQEDQDKLLSLSHGEAHYDNESASLQSRFDNQVALTPNAIALIEDGVQMTYNELDVYSNQLCHLLISQGVNARDKVGIYLHRSINSTAAIIATLKVGATYVPLDPTYPQSRLSYMIEDSALTAMFVESSSVPLTDIDGIAQIDIDQVNPDTLPQHTAIEADSSVPIYALYTSGSTGKPKGVLGTQQGLVNRLNWMWDRYPFVQGEVNCHKTSLNFVDHAWELFGSLLRGVPTLIINGNDSKDIFAMSSQVAQYKVSRLVLVPSLLDAILSLPEHRKEAFKTVQYWTSSGEALPFDSVRAFYQSYPASALLNIYGSSEVAADVTYFDTRELNLENTSSATVPIGKPITNVSLIIADSQGNPVPVGSVGELYIGGDCLAHGYTQITPTLERFVTLPSYHGKLFKTGDLVKWNINNQLEFIGRTDFQVKIRGHRIDIADIESNLRAIEGVEQCIVTSTHLGTETSLVAYIVAASEDSKPSCAQLRIQLLERLPEYMVPAFIEILDTMPLTPNGKIDRNALPNPTIGTLDVVSNIEPPRSATELEISAIWSELFKLDEVCINQSFFSLGGNSILAVKFAALVEKSMGKTIGLQQLFADPTIKGIASSIAINSATVIPNRKSSNAPLSFAQERLLFIERLEQGTDAYHLPTLLELDPSVDTCRLKEAIDIVVERHQILRTVFSTDSTGADYQHVTSKSCFTNEFNAADNDDIYALITPVIEKPFDFENECPLRVCFVSQSDKTYLLFVFHHIAVDGWSTDIFMSEVSAIYSALLRGQSPTLADLGIQYADYAAWQRDTLDETAINQQVSYWKKQIDGADTLSLITDHNRPQNIDYRGENVLFELDEVLSSSLRELAQSCDTTLYTVLLAGFANMLKTLSGQSDFIIGTPSDNRENAQLHNLIGFFVNTLPLRICVDPEASSESLIKDLHLTLAEAKSHQALPFEKLVSSLNVPRDTSRHPIFQTMFSLQSFGSNAGNHGETQFGQIIPTGSTTESVARYDLSLFIDDSESCIKGRFNYALSLFDHSTIEHYVSLYIQSLKNIVASPKKALSKQHLITDYDKEIVYQYQNTLGSVSSQHSLPTIFSKFVSETPTAPAVVTPDGVLSYEQLNEKANQLASTLINAQASCESTSNLIPLMMTPCADLLVAIIGILKAGCAYVPVSPDYPLDRIEYILKDIGAKTIVTQSSFSTTLEAVSEDIELYAINVDDENLQLASSDDPKVRCNTDELAYVIYTSGTTGQPKGVMVEQGNVINYLKAISPWMDSLNNIDFSTNYCFDLTVTTTLIPLLSGKCVCVYTGDILDSNEYQEHLVNNRIEMVKTTPSLAKVLLNHYKGNPLSMLMLGGEALEASTLESLALNSNLILDEYGPTETTVGAMLAQVHPRRDNGIGFAYPNVGLYNLSSNGQPSLLVLRVNSLLAVLP